MPPDAPTRTSRAVRTCRRAEQTRPTGDGPYCRCGCDGRPGQACAKCGHRPRRRGRGTPQIIRGLCPACYCRENANGTLADWPRTTRTRDDVLDDWVILRAQGYTRRQAAERLGMTLAAFDGAIYRARRDDDPRALPPLTRETGRGSAA